MEISRQDLIDCVKQACVQSGQSDEITDALLHVAHTIKKTACERFDADDGYVCPAEPLVTAEHGRLAFLDFALSFDELVAKLGYISYSGYGTQLDVVDR